jgi:imidazoleglycerol phosphate dehydratase HisB
MMGLHIPADAKCMTPGCNGRPFFVLSVRMRRKDSGATWAPNLPAYFCDVCANSGCEMDIRYLPTKTGHNHISVSSSLLGAAVERVTEVSS